MTDQTRPSRICVVGPVTPFRSGIARHTTALAEAISALPGTSVSVVSFRRLYPKALYPGEEDRDPALSPPSGLPVAERLDTLNPFTWRRAVREISDGRPDLVVMPAWTFFVAPCLGTVARCLRRRDIPVVTVVHNAVDHEAAAWKHALMTYQLRATDRFVTHNRQLEADTAALAPGVPVTVSPHPVYDVYPEAQGALPRDHALELLFFGLVRPYKGLDIALEALARSGLKDVRLTIAGEFWSGEEETRALIKRLGLTDRVDLVPRYVSDAEAAEYFHRADAVLAPYRSATGSGVVSLAQHYGRPVVASDVPGLAEAIRHGETGWLFGAGDAGALADLLARTVSREAAGAMAPALREARADLGWDRFAARVLGQSRENILKPLSNGA